MRYLLYAEQNYSYAILRPLQDAIHRRGDEVVWFLAGDEIRRDYLHADEREFTSIKDAVNWQPDVVLVPGNHVPKFIPGIKVGIFHGFNVAKSTRPDDRGHFNIRGCFDLYCTQGPNTTVGFQHRAEKYGFFGVRQTGWSAIDPLFQNLPTDLPNDGKKTILLCSTFTKELSCAPLLIENVRQLRDSGKWRWLVQFHPKMPQEIVAAYKALQNEYLTFVETDNVIPLLQRADLMVCDTSSVMTMFLLQRKPVVTFRNQTRGNTEHLINVTDANRLEEAIDDALSYPAALMARIDRFIADTHPYQDGKSSERVLAAVDDFQCTQYGKLKAKPANIIRTLKERNKLGYWKL
ncbi:CDP-glycerol glycerophosphotransferase family protein [Shewanella sp.]|uniref:CDP-glycerol glycerophosphotransferase family protein n=1 Tax=Shewanella sp. TaxID=50422 RepID=UPI003A97196A